MNCAGHNAVPMKGNDKEREVWRKPRKQNRKKECKRKKDKNT
jgi:hypothetical protein